jgi:hypothetical protein
LTLGQAQRSASNTSAKFIPQRFSCLAGWIFSLAFAQEKGLSNEATAGDVTIGRRRNVAKEHDRLRRGALW